MLVLTSPEGNHSPDTWALATAGMILDCSGLPLDRQVPALDLQAKVARCLAMHYSALLGRERIALAKNPEHCSTPYDTNADEVVRDIGWLAEGTPWGDHLKGDAWRDAAENTIRTHFESALHIERLLHADRHPDNPSAVAYKQRFNG